MRAELRLWESAITPLRAPTTRWGYRRKALLHARWREDRWQFGLVRFHGREEEFIPIPECPLHDPAVNAAFERVSSLAPADWPLAFGLASGVAFTLVLKSRRREDWLHELRGWDWPPGFSLYVNWHPNAGRRAVDSRRTELVGGEGKLLSAGLVHGPLAFRQQIPQMEDLALGLSEAWLGGAGVDRVVDLYCGLGASLHRWRVRGWEAAGVELSGESLDCARVNAPGAVLLRGRTEDRFPQLKSFINDHSFNLYTNPPRSGHDPRTLAWIQESRPRRIAYLSCHPRSLGGDLRVLAARYRVAAIHPLDFFPQTKHVECLALLEDIAEK